MTCDAANVMIAGVGGASLGTELLKALTLAGRYRIFGCDISPIAYGLHAPGFARTYRADRADYAQSVIDSCRDAGAAYLIPGGEQPMVLLGAAADRLWQAGIRLVGNDPAVIQQCSDKAATFRQLSGCGVSIPKTAVAQGAESIREVGLPCVIKPATGTGGSTQVFFAADMEEALLYAGYIKRSGKTPIAQEYVSADEGEFTVGVLSYPDGSVAASIALRRALDAKLSVMMRDRGGVISSGYSQGCIADFREIREQCEEIARRLGSKGPLNIQGRLSKGRLVPFEINPRFSASTYLRAMAGVNEVDMFLQHLITGAKPRQGVIREGWYLRSLTEQYVPPENVAP